MMKRQVDRPEGALRRSRSRRRGLRVIAATSASLLTFLLHVADAEAGDGRVEASPGINQGDTNFSVSFRYPPTVQQVADVKSAVSLMALGFCDATDGNMRIRRVTLLQGQATEDQGDYWLHARNFRSGVRFFFNGSNLGRLGAHVDMGQGAVGAPDVWLHEFGHHALGLGDEYDEQRRWGLPCGIGPSFDPGTIDEQNHTIMQQSGSARCVGGANPGAGCLRDSDCAAMSPGGPGTCQLVLMSELSVPANHDPLQGDGSMCPAVTPPCTDQALCMRSFNSGTGRFERSQQSEIHNGQSDWTTLVENYPFVVAPIGLPDVNPPATCFRNVEFVENVVGSDQVLLLLDRSGSMGWSSSRDVMEVCRNGLDDDHDGQIDEADCAEARLSFVKDAASAYLDLQVDRGVDVGILTFDQAAVLDLPITTLTSANHPGYRALVDGLGAGGQTGIGDALDASGTEFARVARVGRSRTAYLMTDGINTSGGSPADAAARLHDIGVRIHVIPAGSDVNELELGGVASATGGTVFPAASTADLPALYAELAARHQGAALVLARSKFDLSITGRPPREGPRLPPRADTPPERTFILPVEKNAESLVAFVAGRNTRMKDWAVNVQLRGPQGELFDASSPELTIREHYLFARVRAPSEGNWALVVRAAGPALQQGTAVAFVENPEPDLFADVGPRVLHGGGRTFLTAQPIFGTELDGVDTQVVARVTAPNGNQTTAALTQSATGQWGAELGPYFESGLYGVEVQAVVGAAAQTMLGESIFAGPDRDPVIVSPFQRLTTTSFAIVRGQQGYPCIGVEPDCDSDGVHDREECPGVLDLDRDGRPNGRDDDADGDEIPDAVERLYDRDQNGVRDLCEVGPYLTK